MVTRAWKVYGADGHKQRISFEKSTSADVSKYRDVETHYELLCSDKTGTNEYVVLKVTAATAEDCEKELNGQLSDGIFENARYGTVEEIEPNDWN